MAGRIGILSRVDASVKCIVRILEVDEHRGREKLKRKAKIVKCTSSEMKHFKKKKKRTIYECVYMYIYVLNRL